MGDIEFKHCDNHLLKYDNCCKYSDIHLVGYNSVIKLKLQAHDIILYHSYVKKFYVTRLYALQFV